MASAPFKHPKTGVFYFRRKVPERLAKRIGKSWIKRSLGTKNPREAKELFAIEAARVEQLFKNADTLTDLSFKQVTALAAEWYAARLKDDEAEPGDPEGLGTLLTDLSLDPSYAEKVSAVGGFVGATLEARGLVVSDDTYAALVSAFYENYRRLVWFLSKRAKGNYEPDPIIEAAPKFERENDKPKVSLDDLVSGWALESRPRERTQEEFKRAVTRLGDFIGSQDAHKVTPDKVAEYKAYLLTSGKSHKTTKNNLSALSAVFGWGFRNRKLSSNPIHGISIKVKKRPDEGRRSFTMEEACRILEAASRAQDGKRWVPLILAYSGARVGEVAQLLKDDVRQVEGIWCLDLNARAAAEKSLKNVGSSRLVPLHPEIIRAGFLDFVKESKDGAALFPDFPKRKKGTRGDNASAKLSRWVRSQTGIGKGDRSVAPNHSWRHLFKDRCREADIRNEVQDEITGHRPGTVARSYGSRQFPVKVLYEAILKLPAITSPA